ncbi:MAG: hypothetical protein LBF89_12390 [Bacteroidales bacterium]|jgi:DNA repair exonuclease SbcCD ATPase subunit|nr:hypothetical protein [Bacteroidales bacterium]
METKEQYGEEPKSCVIANPIYDTVFKRLMENERIARFFLSTLLDENILSIKAHPQEFTYRKKTKESRTSSDDDNIGYSIYRIDFMATIETKEGEWKKILIEVQKSWDETDVIRFRNYLAEQYKIVDRINGEEIVLPITTIYILGGRLAEIESPCIKVERHYRDLVHGNAVEAKSPFVEKLTHDSYVIQAGRITDKRYGTKLNELLSLFEQAHFIREDSEVSKQYAFRSDDKEIRFITSILNEMVADPAEREEIEKEAEALRTIDALFGKTHRKQKRIIEEQEKALEEKDKALEEKDSVIGEQAKALEEQSKALEEQAKALEEQAKALKEKDKAYEEQARQLAEMRRRSNAE